MCKFLGTGFGVDACSALRKVPNPERKSWEGGFRAGGELRFGRLCCTAPLAPMGLVWWAQRRAARLCPFGRTGTVGFNPLPYCQMMGARALQRESGLGAESFLPNATSAAEGDNTIMELKVPRPHHHHHHRRRHHHRHHHHHHHHHHHRRRRRHRHKNNVTPNMS